MRTKAATNLTFRYGIAALLAASVLTAACGAEAPPLPGPTVVGTPVPVPPPGGQVTPPNETPPVGNPEQPPARNPQIAGTYALENSLDMSSVLPERVLGVVDTIHAVADDPAGFLLDQAISRLEDGFVKSALNTGRSLAAPLINEWIEDNAPAIVNDIRNVAIAVGDAVHKLQFGSKLVLTGDAGAMPANHYIDSFFFDFNGERLTLSVLDLGEQSVASAEGFQANVSGTSLTVGEHNLSFNYGQVIIGAVNKLIIPRLSPGATNIGELLVSKIDCEAVGARINDAVSLVSADIAAGACDLGLQAGAGFISSKIEGLALDSDAIKLSGLGNIADQNGDLTYDQINNGRWTATIAIGGNTTVLNGESDIFAGGR